MPTEVIYGVSLFDNSVCTFFIPDGETTYGPLCFGGLYAGSVNDYHDFSAAYGDIIHIMQGDEFVCFTDRTTQQASCLGDVRDFSANGNDWNVFSNIHVMESDVTETSVAFIDPNRNIKLYGSIVNIRNATLVDSVFV